MTTQSDPLMRLVVNQIGVNRELLATILEDKVRLDPKAGVFSFKPDVRVRLGNRRTVITALLAQKALHLLAGENSECLMPRVLETLTGIRGNTLRPILKQLTDAGLVVRYSKGYTVPGAVIEDVARELTEEV